MAAPVADKIILPLDTGNLGKNVRTQTRTVGAFSVHEHFFIPTSARSVLGKYKASTGLLTIPAAVHNGTTTGYCWLANPVGSVVKMGVQRISMTHNFIVIAVDLLTGEVRFSRNTFTGVGSGTIVTPAKRDSTDATAVGTLFLTSATWAQTLGATFWNEQYQTQDLVTGGAGHWMPYKTEFVAEKEEDQIVLRAGEAIAIWHSIAVTTANRRAAINFAWEEFE